MTTTASQTIHERVVQVIQQDGAYQARRLEIKEAITQAKQAEDALRLDAKYNERLSALVSDRDSAIKQAQGVCDAVVAKARVPLDAATRVFEAAAGQAQGAFNKVRDEAVARYTERHAGELKAAELAAAKARAAVHAAQQELAVLQTSIDQHRRQVLDRLGFDLNKMTP